MKGNEFLNRTNSTKQKRNQKTEQIKNDKCWRTGSAKSETFARNVAQFFTLSFWISFFSVSREDANLWCLLRKRVIHSFSQQMFSMDAGNHDCTTQHAVVTVHLKFELEKKSCSLFSIQFCYKQWIYNVIEWSYISFAVQQQFAEHKIDGKVIIILFVKLLWQCH